MYAAVLLSYPCRSKSILVNGYGSKGGDTTYLRITIEHAAARAAGVDLAGGT